MKPRRPILRLLAAAAIVALAVLPARGLAPLPIKPDLVVAVDGSGDFTTIHAAVQSIPRANRERKIVLVKNGLYAEKVRVEAANVTLRGESRTGTRIEFTVAQGQGRDERGQAVVNLARTAHDFVLENLTVRNTHGVLGIHAFAVYGQADRTVIVDCDIHSQGNDTLSLWRGRAENAAELAAAPSADPTILQDGGRYYHARLNVTGSVDFICPRGWCYMVDSTITEVNPGATAAMWHDGSFDPDKKFVMKGCTFDGPPNWYLARHHHEAHFYFLDCTFSPAMRDKPPYRVIYPLDGGPAVLQKDIDRNKELDKTNLYGTRSYFWNSHRVAGDYVWHRDNLASAPGTPKPEQITAKWTFAGTWDPERTDRPKVRGIAPRDGGLEVTFTESVTVKGKPLLALRGGGFASYVAGSGTSRLRFETPSREPANAVRFEIDSAAIVASEAYATLRVADLTLP